MPTYAYKCESCGFGKDEWLKMSEAKAELVCPSCGKPTYRKQLTAPAFHLKGGGWYVSDFRDGGSKPAAADKPAESAPAKDAAPACACPAAATCPAATGGSGTSGSS